MKELRERVSNEQRRSRHLKVRASLIAPLLAASGALAGLAAGSLASTAPAAASSVLVKTATVPKYGKILVNASGLALYYDTANKPGKWACTGNCLTAWPPLLLPKGQAKVSAAPGIMGLSAVKCPQGMQVAWENKPLYTFIKDSAGTVKGQGLGNVWYVAQLKVSATATTKGGSWA
ncbi:MAG TPA: hypothetical protein VED59_06370 [Acidimicrobiales bacterium]|nr:hypothetical protein [Acidimicrobiales bacterium]